MVDMKKQKTIDLVCDECQIITPHKVGKYIIRGKIERKDSRYQEFINYRRYTCTYCKTPFCYDENFIPIPMEKLLLTFNSKTSSKFRNLLPSD